MLHPCSDYYKNIPHAPHDWLLDDIPLECPGRWDDGGNSSVLSLTHETPPNDGGCVAREFVAV